MAEPRVKSLAKPDEVMRFPRLTVRVVDLGDMEVGPEEVFDIPPGHNGWVIGDEPVVQVEWAGSEHSPDSRPVSTVVPS